MSDKWQADAFQRYNDAYQRALTNYRQSNEVEIGAMLGCYTPMLGVVPRHTRCAYCGLKAKPDTVRCDGCGAPA